MIVGFTGHRKLENSYSTDTKLWNFVSNEIERNLSELGPDKCISGMAIGTDMVAAEICIKLNIPLICAIPFRGQEGKWPKPVQNKYSNILDKAKEINFISKGGYSANKLQIRNEWIVDNCDILLAVFNGKPSGTKNCIDYASKINRKIVFIKV